MATIDQLRSRLESGWDEIDHGRSAKQDLWRSLLSLAATLGADKADWRLLRAPGRVNLIGEHTDYNGLPVMPAALDREVMMVFRPLPGGRVRVVNLEAADVRAAIQLSPDGARGNRVCITTLSGTLTDENTPGDPRKVAPVEEERAWSGGAFEHTFTGHSFTILRFDA